MIALTDRCTVSNQSAVSGDYSLAFSIGQAIRKVYDATFGKTAVVSGQSIAGMMATAVLAQSGYYVETYDIRPAFTRNIQWAARQSLVDQLASFNSKLDVLFLSQVARPLYKGSIHSIKEIRNVSLREGVRRGALDDTKKWHAYDELSINSDYGGS